MAADINSFNKRNSFTQHTVYVAVEVRIRTLDQNFEIENSSRIRVEQLLFYLCTKFGRGERCYGRDTERRSQQGTRIYLFRDFMIIYKAKKMATRDLV